MGWGLTICHWLGPPWFNYWFSFTLAYSRISHEYSSLFIIVINLIFSFHFDALTELGAFMRTEFLCVSVLRVASGPRVKLASCKSALNPPRWFALLTVLRRWSRCYSLLLCGLFYEAICCMSFRVSFCIAITSLGKERANLGAFRAFVRFMLVWICRFPPPLGVWEGLRFVIVALPGLLLPFFFLILVLFVRLFDLCLFGFVGFLFLLVSGKGCGL